MSMIRKFGKVFLADEIPESRAVRWLCADVPTTRGNPLAVVKYMVKGKPRVRGVRLDLGKQVFLDEPDDPAVFEAMVNAKGKIIETIQKSQGSPQPAVGTVHKVRKYGNTTIKMTRAAPRGIVSCADVKRVRAKCGDEKAYGKKIKGVQVE